MIQQEIDRRAALAGGLAALITPALASSALAGDGPGGVVMPAPATDSELRGLSPTGGKAWWASGSKGWLVRGEGQRQDAMRIVGAEGLDFRGLHAFDDDHVLAMSAGPGDASQLWRTRDGGRRWTRLAANQDPDGFWDSIAFVDRRRGFILGDPTEGRFTVLRTDDAGETWARLPPDAVPTAAADEGAFAASNGCIALGRRGLVAFCTGGARWARIYLSRNGGRSFITLDTPIPGDAPSRGAFAAAFGSRGELWVCGGDYKAPDAEGVNLAWLAPGSNVFQPVAAPAGYLSGISVHGATVLATGLLGTIVSRDGQRFERITPAPFNSVRLTGKGSAVLCGPKGAIGLWRG